MKSTWLFVFLAVCLLLPTISCGWYSKPVDSVADRLKYEGKLKQIAQNFEFAVAHLDTAPWVYPKWFATFSWVHPFKWSRTASAITLGRLGFVKYAIYIDFIFIGFFWPSKYSKVLNH